MKYSYSLNDEEYHDIDYIAEQIEEDENIISVWVGETLEVKHSSYVDSEDLIEIMQNQAYDDVDELSYDYLEDFKKEDAKELNKLICDFLDNKAKQPNFYKIGKVEKITVDEFYKNHYNKS